VFGHHCYSATDEYFCSDPLVFSSKDTTSPFYLMTTATKQNNRRSGADNYYLMIPDPTTGAVEDYLELNSGTHGAGKYTMIIEANTDASTDYTTDSSLTVRTNAFTTFTDFTALTSLSWLATSRTTCPVLGIDDTSYTLSLTAEALAHGTWTSVEVETDGERTITIDTPYTLSCTGDHCSECPMTVRYVMNRQLQGTSYEINSETLQTAVVELDSQVSFKVDGAGRSFGDMLYAVPALEISGIGLVQL